MVCPSNKRPSLKSESGFPFSRIIICVRSRRKFLIQLYRFFRISLRWSLFISLVCGTLSKVLEKSNSITSAWLLSSKDLARFCTATITWVSEDHCFLKPYDDVLHPLELPCLKQLTCYRVKVACNSLLCFCLLLVCWYHICHFPFHWDDSLVYWPLEELEEHCEN